MNTLRVSGLQPEVDKNIVMGLGRFGLLTRVTRRRNALYVTFDDPRDAADAKIISDAYPGVQVMLIKAPVV